MRREQRVGSYFVLVVILFGLILATFILWDIDLGDDPAKIPPVIQAYITSFILMAAAIFAAARFELFRNFIPHIAVKQKVTHRAISNSYLHVLVTTTIHNNSKVKMDFSEGICRLQRLGQYADAEVEDIYRQKFLEDTPSGNRDFQWETLDEVPLSWDGKVLTVEPGGSHRETCEFIVNVGVTSLLAHTYFRGLNTLPVPEGWGVTTAHDIIILEQAHEVSHED